MREDGVVVFEASQVGWLSEYSTVVVDASLRVAVVVNTSKQLPSIE